MATNSEYGQAGVESEQEPERCEICGGDGDGDGLGTTLEGFMCLKCAIPYLTDPDWCYPPATASHDAGP
jgi:hypothetical protein